MAASTAAIADLLGARSIVFDRSLEPAPTHPGRIRHDATIEGLRLRSTPEGYDLGADSVHLEIRHGQRLFGEVVITPTPGRMVSLDARTGAVTLADQLAMTLACIGDSLGVFDNG